MEVTGQIFGGRNQREVWGNDLKVYKSESVLTKNYIILEKMDLKEATSKA